MHAGLNAMPCQDVRDRAAGLLLAGNPAELVYIVTGHLLLGWGESMVRISAGWCGLWCCMQCPLSLCMVGLEHAAGYGAAHALRAGLAQMEAAGDLDDEDSEDEDADFDAGGAEADDASDDDMSDASEDDEVGTALLYWLGAVQTPEGARTRCLLRPRSPARQLRPGRGRAGIDIQISGTPVGLRASGGVASDYFA